MMGSSINELCAGRLLYSFSSPKFSRVSVLHFKFIIRSRNLDGIAAGHTASDGEFQRVVAGFQITHRKTPRRAELNLDIALEKDQAHLLRIERFFAAQDTTDRPIGAGTGRLDQL